MSCPIIAGFVADSTVTSCHRCTKYEYAKLLERMNANSMVLFSPSPHEIVSGIFAVWKEPGVSQRLIGDMRPANAYFNTPSIEFTSGDSLTRMQIPAGSRLHMAKLDLSDYFYSCKATEALSQRFFGLRPVHQDYLVQAGLQLDSSCFDAEGFTSPRLSVLPMGWGPSPALAQMAHENVLYGRLGTGGRRAALLDPILDPQGRWSSLRVPPPDCEALVHALVIDDLLLFKSAPQGESVSPGNEISALRSRYSSVGLECRDHKVKDFASSGEALGYRLHDNVWSAPTSRYWQLKSVVDGVIRRQWVRPREVASLVGRFTNLFLLHRPALAIFSCVYIFIQRVGNRTARLWPSVARELQLAIALLPIVRASVSRPVHPYVLQTDASPEGSAMVYSSAVPGGAAALEKECRRPRALLRNAQDNTCNVAEALRSGFEMPLDPEKWKIGYRRIYPPGHSRHINELEMEGAVDAVRWISRSAARCNSRILIEMDSLVSVCALRKGRSSRPGLSKQLRRMAALTLALRVQVEPRWVPTTRNMADGPSRGSWIPSPCV
jgi:hypothetical protein